MYNDTSLSLYREIYVHIYIHTHMCVYVYVYVYVYVHVYVYVYVYIHIHVSLSISLSLYIYIYIYISFILHIIINLYRREMRRLWYRAPELILRDEIYSPPDDRKIHMWGVCGVSVSAPRSWSRALIYWSTREQQRGRVSSNSRSQTVPFRQYSANLSDEH